MDTYQDGTIFPRCATAADSAWTNTFFLTTIIVFFIIPFVILLVLYTVIARHLMANPAISRGPANNLLKHRKQVVLMLGTVVLCFFICLLPFRALTFWIIVKPPQAIVQTMMALGYEGYYCVIYFCRMMLYLNSAINPILYNLMSTKFRDGFMRLCGLSKTKVKRKKESSGRTNTGSTTGTTGSSNQSDYWRRHSSHKSCSVKVPDVPPDKQMKLPLLSAVTGSIIGKKQESYV